MCDGARAVGAERTMNDYRRQMAAVRTRIERLVGVLESAGYRFDPIFPPGPLGRPAPAVEDDLARLERRVGGRVPAALAAFYREIGAVDLRGVPPWRGCDYPDALIVFPLAVVLEEANVSWYPDDVFRAPISPDELHKEGVSGGMFYGIEIPNAGEDPIVLEEGHDLPFTRYLDHALSWGGFPGLEYYAAEHSWPLDVLRQAAAAV